jgi:DNA modification methylase
MPAGSGIKASESFHAAIGDIVEYRNKRSVWHVNSVGFKGAHFATFPPKLIEPCILAGSRPGDVVLDPYGGAGTTALVASLLGRSFILIDGKQEYCDMAEGRISKTLLTTNQ